MESYDLVLLAILAYYIFLGSLFRQKEYVDDLQRKVQDNLLMLQNNLKSDVKLAEDNNDEIDEAVQVWIVKVDKVLGEVVELRHQAREIHNRFQGWGLTCYRLIKTLNQKIATVKKLLVEGRNFPAYVPRLVPEHIQVLPSRITTMKEVIEALMDDNKNLVGVYGMGGVGKTTLVKQVCEEVEKSNFFDKVVLAMVSEGTGLKGIQTQIAESLGIRLVDEEENISAGAHSISAQLKMQNKKILLILEDLWEKLELADVGIEICETKCKILVTSRNLSVCRSMKTAIDIHVNVLSYDDSFELFRQEVGDEYSNAKYFEMSEKIVNKCAGLPLAIIDLARSLRGKTIGIWDAVSQLLIKSLYEDMDHVNASIKLSYDFLGTRETKLCFLLCALFPENCKITMDPLIGYAIGEGLLGDAGSLKEARERLNIMLDTLISSSLLLNERDDGYVMMHPIFRDTAIAIAHSENNESIVRAGMGLLKWPNLRSGRVLRMSLMSNNIQNVPDAPDCSQLMTLSLASNNLLKEIPNEFFRGMKHLTTLDMSKTAIFSLPQSISSLNKCLQSLYLDDCSFLEELRGIGNLETLKMLSIAGSGIMHLPEEIRGLTNLKMLNLSHNNSLKTIPLGVISSLFNLQELYMTNSFSGWEFESIRAKNASLVEVASLTKLSSLELSIKDPKWLSTEISTSHWKNLLNFHIDVSGEGASDATNMYKRYLSITTSPDSFPFAGWVMLMLERTYGIFLRNCSVLENVLLLNPGGFNNLISLKITNGETMKYLVDVKKEMPLTVFTQLRMLDMCNMKQLNSVCNGPLVERSFDKLKVLRIIRCHTLVKILPFALWTKLQNLEEIEIGDCPDLKELIVCEYEGKEGSIKIKLPFLKTLKLWELPRFSAFISHWKRLPYVLECPCLEILQINKCNGLKRLPFHMRKILEELDTTMSFECEDSRGKGLVIEELFNSAQEKIMLWESDKSKIWTSDPEAASEYLMAVDEVRKLMESLASVHFENGNESKLLSQAHVVLQIAMTRLEVEFSNILVQNKHFWELKNMSLRSYETEVKSKVSTTSTFSDEEDPWDDFEQTISACSFKEDLWDDSLRDLKCIADAMFKSNYNQECCQAYINTRKNVLDEYLFALEVHKLSNEKAIEMEWINLNVKIKKWIRTMNILMQVYLQNEKHLCDQIFGDTEPTSLLCFVETSKSSVLQLLSFCETVALQPRRPDKLFGFLDMYKVVSEIISDIETLFPDEIGSNVRMECHEVLKRLGDSVRGTYHVFEHAVESDISTIPLAGGGVHHLTKNVMNYIQALIDYSDSLNVLLKDNGWEDSKSHSLLIDPVEEEENENGSCADSITPMGHHLRSVTSILETNLDLKSKLYRDASLQHIFLMNNIYYMVQKVKNSDLRAFFGDSWIRKHNGKFQGHALSYERTTWISILALLRDEGLNNPGSNSVSKTLLKERFRSFNLAFEEVYRSQTSWLIADSQLRDYLQTSISLRVIQAYRPFMGRYASQLDSKSSEKYIKFSADNLQNYLLDLFEGSPKTLRKR